MKKFMQFRYLVVLVFLILIGYLGGTAIFMTSNNQSKATSDPKPAATEAAGTPSAEPAQSPAAGKNNQEIAPEPSPSLAASPSAAAAPTPSVTPTSTPNAGSTQTPEPSPVPGTAVASGVVNQVKTSQKLVALTFDDGPDGKYTPKILDILKQYNVKGTFYMVGTQAEKFPDVIKRIKDEGHGIGNHSWSHPQMPKLKEPDMLSQIQKTDDAIAAAIGTPATTFRPPYGATNKTLEAMLNQRGQSVVNWSVDTRDWAGTPPQNMIQNVKTHTVPGGIILMHSFGNKYVPNTIAALPEMITYLQQNGYELVTVDQLLSAKE
ncbi:polysaccharide deacetylase [Paenibacillus larvae subsp. larvae]|uniref:Polysaccharide deacetylase n=2 Tax=Paenibacillus larvae TaxID=1464 RepID=A0A2L1U327_9BACL|nr:polysaccharide deacetylase family protein [Paenibacillus larvae]AQZ45361.1 hypothetical protein B5S25_00905 [Paenibacillus larvae subsp. pulvifaciens]AVF27314.1 polysaccharide deacetylase [Paenibacillus larvae subsp. larvae]AVF31977.1 polysaccharide deacetylase [Paenibacillus larvae subsp. larvae]MCY7520610.1 polysaccharide deacetylase family protein [Paenibacillus larvae]MCY9499332.1 polysaccharide deacetylase family protein [Paenibacillus larvae]